MQNDGAESKYHSSWFLAGIASLSREKITIGWNERESRQANIRLATAKTAEAYQAVFKRWPI